MCPSGEMYGQMLAQVPFRIYGSICYKKLLVRRMRGALQKNHLTQRPSTRNLQVYRACRQLTQFLLPPTSRKPPLPGHSSHHIMLLFRKLRTSRRMSFKTLIREWDQRQDLLLFLGEEALGLPTPTVLRGWALHRRSVVKLLQTLEASTPVLSL
jgi:hypothetical protein